MSEVDRIKDQFVRTSIGQAWHGPAVLESLEGVSLKQALARPIISAHTIAELALHIKAWVNITTIRLEGKAFNASAEDDWPEVNIASEEEWTKEIESLKESVNRLAASISSFQESRLDGLAAGQNYSNYFMLHGLIQHNVYHAGQISLLKKALG